MARRTTRRRRKKPFTQAKARKVLREKRPTLRGRPITAPQRGLLGLIAGGGTPTRLKRMAKRARRRRR